MLRSWFAQAKWLIPVLALLPSPVFAQSCGPNGCAAPTYVGASCGNGNCAPCPQMAGPLYPPNFITRVGNKFGSLFNAGQCCAPTHGCGKYIFCTPRPPHLKFPSVCGNGVCNPCTWDHYGYYNTCWAQWGFPPDYGHCPTPQLAAHVPGYSPRVEYFSSDIRADQPGLVGNEAEEGNGNRGNNGQPRGEREPDMSRRYPVPAPSVYPPPPPQRTVPVSSPYGGR